MKKIKFNTIGEEVYYEKLNNGMDVYLFSKDNFHNNYVTFTTKFGSTYNEFVPIGKDKMIKVPKGVAHFLEHKVFIQEHDPQPSDFFAESGALTNAYTTFKNTTYFTSFKFLLVLLVVIKIPTYIRAYLLYITSLIYVNYTLEEYSVYIYYYFSSNNKVLT